MMIMIFSGSHSQFAPRNSFSSGSRFSSSSLRSFSEQKQHQLNSPVTTTASTTSTPTTTVQPSVNNVDGIQGFPSQSSFRFSTNFQNRPRPRLSVFGTRLVDDVDETTTTNTVPTSTTSSTEANLPPSTTPLTTPDLVNVSTSTSSITTSPLTDSTTTTDTSTTVTDNVVTEEAQGFLAANTRSRGFFGRNSQDSGDGSARTREGLFSTRNRESLFGAPRKITPASTASTTTIISTSRSTTEENDDVGTKTVELEDGSSQIRNAKPVRKILNRQRSSIISSQTLKSSTAAAAATASSGPTTTTIPSTLGSSTSLPVSDTPSNAESSIQESGNEVTEAPRIVKLRRVSPINKDANADLKAETEESSVPTDETSTLVSVDIATDQEPRLVKLRRLAPVTSNEALNNNIVTEDAEPSLPRVRPLRKLFLKDRGSILRASNDEGEGIDIKISPDAVSINMDDRTVDPDDKMTDVMTVQPRVRVRQLFSNKRTSILSRVVNPVTISAPFEKSADVSSEVTTETVVTDVPSLDDESVNNVEDDKLIMKELDEMMQDILESMDDVKDKASEIKSPVSSVESPLRYKLSIMIISHLGPKRSECPI